MNRSPGRATPDHCPDEGVLVGYLDGALEPDERARLQVHLEACPACGERLRGLARRTERVRTWLSRHDPEVPGSASYELAGPRTSGRRGGRDSGVRGRWALAAGVVLAVALAAGPARGWLLERVGLDAWFGSEGGDPTPVEEVSTTAFVPRGPEVTLVFESGVTGRRVVLERSPDSRLTLRVPGPDVELMLGADRVEIRDPDAAARAYRVAVPAPVERLVILVPGAEALVVGPRPGGGERVVEVPRGGG